MNKIDATNISKNRIISIEWYVRHYTPSLPEQAILFKKTLSKTHTVLQYVERSVPTKERNTQTLFSAELSTRECINVPIWIIVGFQQLDRQASRNLNNDTFYRPPVTTAQGNVGAENYSDSGILLIYDGDDYSQIYGQNKEAFKALTKDDILQPYISDNDFRSPNNNKDIRYSSYVFHI